MSKEICVFHLVWAPLGLRYFERFVNSYRLNPGGVDHDLVLIFNGFDSEEQMAPYLDIIADVRYGTIIIKKPTWDLQAYFVAAAQVQSKYLCFLNSYSHLLDSEWLVKMYAAANHPNVGLVGATGSYQSIFSDRPWGPSQIGSRYWVKKKAVNYYLRQKWTNYFACFDPYPNAHIRTNGFLMPRSLMLHLKHPEFKTKLDTIKFESGKKGLTRQVTDKGFAALVVGKDGHAYPVEDWHLSDTFRAGKQHNLLIADNRTEEYIIGDTATKEGLSKLAWGSAEVSRFSNESTQTSR